MNINHFIPPVVTIAYQRLMGKFKSRYILGKYEIEIPQNFTLPNYQKTFKLYDRFLPVLAKNISCDQPIIDIGANIGDTTIAMMQNCKNPFICIEPSDTFFPYLERNLNRLDPADFSRIKTIKKLIGTGSLAGSLDHTVATASLHMSDATDSTTHVALDKVIDDLSNVILLKVDTDGFDFDVIKSAEELLTKSQPILFWENEVKEDFQEVGFSELYTLLEEKGYKYVYIFDNFGNLMAEEVSFDTLRGINSYVYSMKKHNCTRTLYYTDILASTEKNFALIQKAVAEYKAEWINK